MNDDDHFLAETLKQWTVDSELPTDFKSRVWRSITPEDRRSMGPGFDSFFVWIAEHLRHRSIATAVLIVAALIGGGLGGLHAVIDSKETHHRMAETYLQTIDPSRHSPK